MQKASKESDKIKPWTGIAKAHVEAEGLVKATPGSAHLFAHLIARGEPHRLAAGLNLDRFRTGRLIDEAAAAAVAH